MRRFVWVSLSVLALGCGSSTSGGSGTGGNGGGGGAAPQSLVNGLRVSEVSIYQGLKIPLEVEGVPVDPRPTPVVQGREALLRVFVQPNPDWQPREVIVRLELSNSQGLVGAQEIRRVVNGGSVEADFMSAFNFDVAATDIAPDTTYSVGIYEVEPSQTLLHLVRAFRRRASLGWARWTTALRSRWCWFRCSGTRMVPVVCRT